MWQQVQFPWRPNKDLNRFELWTWAERTSSDGHLPAALSQVQKKHLAKAEAAALPSRGSPETYTCGRERAKEFDFLPFDGRYESARVLTYVLLNEGVVCESNPPPPNFGLSSLQNELTDWLQVGESMWNSKCALIRKPTHWAWRCAVTGTHPQAT